MSTVQRFDWDDVRVFGAIARNASLVAGARSAGLDRSTASRRIAALERALGARLFLRTREGLRLSPLGERLWAHAEAMEAQAQELARSANEGERGAVRGLVRLATTEALGAMLVRRGLLALHARHPELELTLLGGNRVVDLARGEADLALRLTKSDQPSLRTRKVASLPFQVVASAEYVKKRGQPRSERELAGHDVLLHSGELASLPEARWLVSRPDVRVVLRTNSIVALLAAAQSGAGICVLAGGAAEAELGLLRLFELPALPARPVYLVLHPDSAARPAVRVVAEHIARLFGAPQPARTLGREGRRRADR